MIRGQSPCSSCHEMAYIHMRRQYVTSNFSDVAMNCKDVEAETMRPSHRGIKLTVCLG